MWLGNIQRGGYGTFWGVTPEHIPDRQMWLAHRLVWWLLRGDPGKPHLHHRCSVKACVRPEHLVPMTLVEHQHVHHVVTRCANGHEFTEANTYIRPDGGGRQCRACKADLQRAKYRADPQAENQRRAQRRKRSRD